MTRCANRARLDRFRRASAWGGCCGIPAISSCLFFMPRLCARRRRRQPSNGTVLVRIKPEDRLERPVEVGREPQGELDGRDIATDFLRQDRVARDLQIRRELFLCQHVLLTELAEPVDDGLLHELRTLLRTALSPGARPTTA